MHLGGGGGRGARKCVDFITCIDAYKHHHNQDIDLLFHHHRDPLLSHFPSYIILTPRLLLTFQFAEGVSERNLRHGFPVQLLDAVASYQPPCRAQGCPSAMAVPKPIPYGPRCCLRGPPKLTNLRCAKWDCDVCQSPRTISRKWRHCLLSSSVTLCHVGPKAALHLPSYTSAHLSPYWF